MIIRSFEDKCPEIGENTFVAETAAIIGDVKIGKDCSVWYSAVIRGDGNSIRIGDRVSVQDCVCIHITNGTESGAVKIGSDVVIGHNATVHACTVGDRCLIGMGSTLLDGAVVNEGAIVAAGALVLGKSVIGSGELWGGVPAKFIKRFDAADFAEKIEANVQEYVHLSHAYLKDSPPTKKK